MIEDYLNTGNGNIEGYDNPENYDIGAGDIVLSMGGDVDIYGSSPGGDCFDHDGYTVDDYGRLSVNGSQSHSLTNDEVQNMSDGLKNHMNNLQIAFEGNLGNHYDQNTLDFLEECQRSGVKLPSSVNHSNSSSEIVVDRCVDSGLKQIDKSIIRDTLDNAYNNGGLSEREFNKLTDMLSRC